MSVFQICLLIWNEIDKIAKKKNTNQRDVSGEAVQQGMLKLLEGADVEVPIGANSKNAMVPLTTVNTRNILFICGGAFPDLEDIIKERLQKKTSMGFNAELKDTVEHDEELLSKVTIEDLRKFGVLRTSSDCIYIKGTRQRDACQDFKRAEKCNFKTVSEAAGIRRSEA